MGRIGRKGANMPKIYGSGASGRVHRHVQSAYNPAPPRPRKGLAWAKSAVVVGGKEYSTGAAADRAMGWRVGATKNALRRGREEYRGVAIARLDD